MLRPLIKSSAKSLMGQNSIVFIDPDSTANPHYLLTSDWVAAADYSIEFKVYFVGDTIRVWGNTSNFQGRLTISSDGSMNWRPSDDGADTGIDAPAGSVPLNELSTIKPVRTGSSGQIFVNGTSVLTAAVFTGTVTIGAFLRQGGSTSGGLVAKPSLVDITTPANSQYYKLNLLRGEIETSNGNTLTYENISEDVRATYYLSLDLTQWANSLRTINIASQA
jgi:hypothetical protein